MDYFIPVGIRPFGVRSVHCSLLSHSFFTDLSQPHFNYRPHSLHLRHYVKNSSQRYSACCTSPQVPSSSWIYPLVLAKTRIHEPCSPSLVKSEVSRRTAHPRPSWSLSSKILLLYSSIVWILATQKTWSLACSEALLWLWLSLESRESSGLLKRLLLRVAWLSS